MTDDHLRSFILLVAAIHAYDRVYTAQTCPDCDATWEGDPICWWCAEAQIRQLETQRAILLTPPDYGHGNPRYDDLDDLDKAVWNRTRGCSGEGSAIQWAARLRRALQTGLVTQHEADQAIARYEKGKAA